MPLIGYTRVSTEGQDVALLLDAFRDAGIDLVIEDRGVSGARTERPGLGRALAFLREDETLVVWKLDRLGRSITHLPAAVAELEGRGLQSLTEAIDTTTPSGKLIFHIFGALG